MFFDRQKRTVSRSRFLASAMEEVETCDSNIFHIVILLPTLCEQEVVMKKMTMVYLIRITGRTRYVAVEVEIHNISTESEDCIITDASPRWRKKEHLSLVPHEAPSSSDIQQHVGKINFKIYSLFLTPEIINYITL